MSDQEFEKQVHRKLEELKLRPSDTVWMEVERNIRMDKRRRRFMWLWMAALFIGVTTSGYILYSYIGQTHKTVDVAQATPPTLSNTKPVEASTHSTKQTTTLHPDTDNTTTPTGEKAHINSLSQTGSEQPTVETPVAVAETSRSKAVSNNKKQPVFAPVEDNATSKSTINRYKKPVQQPLTYNSSNTNPGEGINTNTLTHKKSRNNKKKIIQETFVTRDANVQQETMATIEASQPGQQTFNITMPVMANDVDSTIATNKAAKTPFNSKRLPFMLPDSTSSKTASARSITRRKTSLWHWGVTTDAGYSRIAESKLLQLRGLLGTEKYLAEDLSSRSQRSPAPSNNTSAALSNSGAIPAPKKASPIQPDFSFSAGFFVQRTLSPRLKISFGLEYAYMSVNTQVGKRVDSSIAVNMGTTSLKVVPTYYESPGYIDAVRGGTNISANFQSQSQGTAYYSQKKRYRFHYIEIPVMLNWQINKGRSLPPIQLEGGFSIARLISADALHYEGIKGVYYEDNELLNKTQFNFVTGLSVGLLQRSRHPLWIGPNLRYALNGLVKKEVSTGQYIWSTGISVKMLLGRL